MPTLTKIDPNAKNERKPRQKRIKPSAVTDPKNLLPNPEIFQQYRASVYLPTANGSKKELVYRKARINGKVVWVEDK